MTQAFKRSRIASRAVMLLSVAIAAALWFRDRDQHIIVPIIASTLMLGIGYFSARIVGNLSASTENTRRLGYLHMELDPQKFLDCYRDIPGKVRPGTANHAILRSYLAGGHAAAGDYAAALEVLAEDPPADSLALEGLYAGDRAAYHLGLGNPEEAAEQISQLESVIDACRLNKAELAKNLTEVMKIRKQHLRCLEGKKVDTEWLEDAFERAQFNLRRLEIAQILASAALRDGDAKAAKKHLRYLRENGGKTCYKTWADRQH